MVVPSVGVAGAAGRASAAMRAAASARVAGGGGAEGTGGGAEGPALSRKKYGEKPVLTASIDGATYVLRNHGSSGGMQLPFSTGVGGVSVGIE